MWKACSHKKVDKKDTYKKKKKETNNKKKFKRDASWFVAVILPDSVKYSLQFF